jgi:hypothetical protein
MGEYYSNAPTVRQQLISAGKSHAKEGAFL